MGAEISSKFLTILKPVRNFFPLLHNMSPYYIVVFSNQEDMIVNEFEMKLPLRGYIAAKDTS